MNGASFEYLSHLKNYKYSGDLHLQKQVGLKLDYFGIRAIGLAWSLATLMWPVYAVELDGSLGSVIIDCGYKHYNRVSA